MRCGHFTLGNPKSHFQQCYSYILLIIYVILEETNSNCGTAALAVYLLLFSASYYLRLGTVQEERMYLYGRVEACGAACCDMG